MECDFDLNRQSIPGPVVMADEVSNASSSSSTLPSPAKPRHAGANPTDILRVPTTGLIGHMQTRRDVKLGDPAWQSSILRPQAVYIHIHTRVMVLSLGPLYVIHRPGLGTSFWKT